MNCVWSLAIFRSNNIRSRNNGFRISQNFLCWSSGFTSDLEGNSRCLISLEEENINRIDIDTVRLPNKEGLSERVLLVLFDNDLFNFNSLNLNLDELVLTVSKISLSVLVVEDVSVSSLF